MSERVEIFADRLAVELFRLGWLPLDEDHTPDGCLRILVAGGVEVYLVAAADRERLDLASEPLLRSKPGKRLHRLVLYLSEGDRSEAGTLRRAVRRKGWSGRSDALGLVEIDSRRLTLSRPGGWFGSFHPPEISQAVQGAFQAPAERVDFEAVIAGEQTAVHACGDFLRAVRPLWTPIFVGLAILLTLVAAVCGGSEDSYTLFRMGALWSPSVFQGREWWRPATCTVLHFGWLHLVFNCYSIYSVGTLLERILGRGPYLLILTGSALGGSLASLFGHTRPTLSAGLSGGLFGLAASVCVLSYTRRIPMPATVTRALASGLTPAIVYNLAFGFVYSGIDNYAHLGGLGTGAALTWLLYPRALDALVRPQPARILYGIPTVYAVALVLGVVGFVQKPVPFSPPLQSYHLAGMEVHFGSEFALLKSEGVMRIYQAPGCILALGLRPKLNWPNQQAYLDQASKEMPLARLEQLAGHDCMLWRTQQQGQPSLTCNILDVGGDVLQVELLGPFVNGRRDRALLEKIVATVQGPPSHWGR